MRAPGPRPGLPGDGAAGLPPEEEARDPIRLYMYMCMCVMMSYVYIIMS